MFYQTKKGAKALEKVLVVDDEKAICSSLEFALEDQYQVYLAENPEHALIHLSQEDIKVVLLDLKLGHYNGLDLLRQIKKDYKDAIVIMMTAYGSIKTSVEAIKNGAYYYLSKPVNIEELKLLMDKALEYYRLSAEVKYLNKEVKEKYNLGNIIGKSPGMKKVYDLIEKIKDIDSNVLITGESGTGKEMVAKAIHYFGNRANHRFEVINCAAIPSNLLESELFGHEKGAFTGAISKKIGRFELAHQGTIFLDEIGDMDYGLQSKLLRVLQSKDIIPLGSNKSKKIDVRVIAATNKDLEQELEKASFREDLFYRLNVIPIKLPPLRERKEDVPLLVEKFIQKYSLAFKKPIKEIDTETLEVLESYNFKGNVRELENIIERAVALSTNDKINCQDLPFKIRANKEEVVDELNYIKVSIGDSLKQIEKTVIEKTLEFNQGNKKKTAAFLKISERGLHYKIKEYNIK